MPDMVSVRVEAVVHSPRNAVYGYLSDLANYHKFLQDSFALFEVTTPSSQGVGAAMKYLCKITRGEPAEMRITGAADPVRLEGRGKHGDMPFTLTFQLEEIGRDKTQVTLEYSYQRTGMLDGLTYRPAARRAYEQAMKRLAGNLGAFAH